MKRCRICGAENTEAATHCCGCGIGFSVPPAAPAKLSRRRKPLTLAVVATAVLVIALAVAVGHGRQAAVLPRKPVVRPLPIESEQRLSAAPMASAAAEVPSAVTPAEPAPSPEAKRPQESLLELHPELNRFIPLKRTVAEDDRQALRLPPYDLGREFANHPEAWQVDWEEFQRRHPGIWYSTDGDRRRSIRSDGVTFFGYVICENLLEFDATGLVRIQVSVFNKGVAGSVLSEGGAREVVDRVTSQLEARRLQVAVAAEDGKSVTRYEWLGAPPFVRAVMGESVIDGENCAEYLNFTLELAESEPLSVPRDLRSNRCRQGGDVYLKGIPMVNQGQTGYCVPATISRLLGYYGIDADMHELALVMETECGGGTLVGGDFPTLDKIAAATGLTRTDYRNFEVFNAEYFERYNAAARAAGGKELLVEDFTAVENHDGEQVRVRHYDWMAEELDPEIQRQSRDYDQAGYARFRAGIVESIECGCPLLWSVDRLFPWDRSDGWAGGGHMRLIVGYNSARDEVLYSDSWGSGNELKRASMSEAWSVTDFLSCLKP